MKTETKKTNEKKRIIEGDLKLTEDFKFEGEVKIDSIKYKGIDRKKVMKNNETSGKVTTPSYIGEEVIILFPKVPTRIMKKKEVSQTAQR